MLWGFGNGDLEVGDSCAAGAAVIIFGCRPSGTFFYFPIPASYFLLHFPAHAEEVLNFGICSVVAAEFVEGIGNH